MTHRNWFSYIFIGLSAALLAFIAVVYTPTDEAAPRVREEQRTDAETTETPSALSASEYESAARGVVTSYQASGDAAAAYNVLIAFSRVPADYQQAHLDLVVAFAQVQSGNTAEGEERLADALATYPWLAE